VPSDLWLVPSGTSVTVPDISWYAVVSADGAMRMVESRQRLVRVEDGRQLILHALTDVTPHHEERNRLRAQNRRDPLTGIGNRVAVHEALTAAGLSQTPAALVMLDLDGFKPVNDTLGHAAGDEVLQVVARAIDDAVRAHDTVARVGGDEFVAIVLMEPGEEPGTIAGRLAAAVQEALDRHPPAHRLGVGVSVGSTAAGESGVEPAELLRIADLRMYEAKRSARQARQGGQGSD
jgi:diguanylate cyclase (GGDEF)-like protein